MRITSPAVIVGMLLLVGCTPASPGTGTAGSSSSAVPCTMEAKLCPDGSSVGRTGPNCEFAACPDSSSASGSTLQSVSDGTVTFSYSAPFALAVTPEQVTVTSYIPPCDAGFAYCLFYNGTGYAGSNFESAGFGIKSRTDLSDTENCLTGQPDGYTDLVPSVNTGDGYSTSLFAPLSDAGAGHFANDRLYRLSVGTACYEFRERIGQTQFANYPDGTIKEFTPTDAANVQAALDVLLQRLTIANGKKIVFPVTPGTAS